METEAVPGKGLRQAGLLPASRAPRHTYFQVPEEGSEAAREPGGGRRTSGAAEGPPRSGFLPAGRGAGLLRTGSSLRARGLGSQALFFPPRLTFFSTLLFLGRLSRLRALILFCCFSAIFKRGVVSLSGETGVVWRVEGALSPPIAPVQEALCCQSYKV